MMEREIKKAFKSLRYSYACWREYDESQNIYRDLNTFYPKILKKFSPLRMEEFRGK